MSPNDQVKVLGMPVSSYLDGAFSPRQNSLAAKQSFHLEVQRPLAPTAAVDTILEAATN